MNMIKIAFLLLLLLCLKETGYGQVMNDANSIQEAIANIKKVAPDGSSNPLQMRQTSEYQALEKSSPAIWTTAINNLDVIASDESDQAILFQSFEGLPPSIYAQFLNRALDLYSERKIGLGVLTGIFFPAGKMQFFISHNYDQPEVASFLERAETILTKKGEPLMFNVREARSGKLKQLNDAVIKNHPELFSPVIPWLRQPAKSIDPSIRPSEPLPTSNVTSKPVAPISTSKVRAAPSGFPVVPVAILGALIVVAVVFLLRRRSR